ncbi:TetR/AcrR family transcriptional regulator [Deltaproteobacteria bacterium TL4]
MKKTDPTVKEEILSIAIELFANRGFDGTSVNDIASRSSVTKPMIYYYFNSKVGLYQGVVDLAIEKTYHAMKQAVDQKAEWKERLIGVLQAVFNFTRNNVALSRITFITAFASPEMIPKDVTHREKAERNFAIVHSLIQEGIESGDLRKMNSLQMTTAIYGLMMFQVMGFLIRPEIPLDQSTAEMIVELYLQGAGVQGAIPPK